MLDEKAAKFAIKLDEMIRLDSARGGDCPASPVCKHLGTVDRACLAGGNTTARVIENCLASVVMLLAPLRGLLVEPPPPEKKIQGFRATDEPSPGSEQEDK